MAGGGVNLACLKPAKQPGALARPTLAFVTFPRTAAPEAGADTPPPARVVSCRDRIRQVGLTHPSVLLLPTPRAASGEDRCFQQPTRVGEPSTTLQKLDSPPHRQESPKKGTLLCVPTV